MKRKTMQCVCRCTPQGACGQATMDARTLHQVIKEGLTEIHQATNMRTKAHRALLLGELCENSGAPMTAIRIWSSAIADIEYEDYEWVDRPLNPRYMRLDDLVSREECQELARRIDALWRRLGHKEMAVHLRQVTGYYNDLWFDKYYDAL